MSKGGKKNDAGKPWLALIPPEAEWEEGKAYTDGKDKYGMFNYTEGLSVMRVMSGVRRHINLFLRGEDIDPDSKSQAHHLGCARAGLGMVLHMLVHRPDLDDRYKPDTCEHPEVLTAMKSNGEMIAYCQKCEKKIDMTTWVCDNIDNDKQCCGKCKE